MKNLLPLLFLVFASQVVGQSIEVFVTTSSNQFRDAFGGSSGHFTSSYDINSSYSIGVGINQFRVQDSKLLVDIRLSYSNYIGDWMMSNGGLGSKTSFGLAAQKQLLHLEVHPLHLRLLKKRLRFALGLEYSRTILGELSGHKSTSTIVTSVSREEINSTSSPEINMNRLGIVAKILYEMKISTSISIIPSFVYSRGLSNEFSLLPDSVYLDMFRIGIGVQKRLK